MNLRRALLVALVVACASLLPSCEQSAGKARQPDLITRSTETRAVFHVTWRTRAELDALYPGDTGHARWEYIDGERHVYIDAVEPVDFNDFDRLESLGHECWHGFGATHK